MSKVWFFRSKIVKSSAIKIKNCQNFGYSGKNMSKFVFFKGQIQLIQLG